MKRLIPFLIAIAAFGQAPIERQIQCEDAGSNDTYACTFVGAVPTAYVTGQHYRFKAGTVNTGAATITFTPTGGSAIGAKTIVKVAGGITTALADNDIRAGQWVDLIYDGTNMQMQSLLGNAPSGGSSAYTETRLMPLCSSQNPLGGGTWIQYAGSFSNTCTYTANGGTAFSFLPEAGEAAAVTTFLLPVGATSIDLTVYWQVSGSPGGNDRFGVSTSCANTGSPYATWTFNTESLQTIAEGASASAYKQTTFSAVSIGSCTANTISVRFRRLPADGADTSNQDSVFHGGKYVAN